MPALTHFPLQATSIWQGTVVTVQGSFKVPQSTFITNLGLSPALPNWKVRHTIFTGHLVTWGPTLLAAVFIGFIPFL